MDVLISIDGKKVKQSNLQFDISLFLYNSVVLYEDLLVYNSKVLFWDKYQSIILKSFDALNVEQSERQHLVNDTFKNEVEVLVKRNGFFPFAVVRALFFINTSSTGKVRYVLLPYKRPLKDFVLNETGPILIPHKASPALYQSLLPWLKVHDIHHYINSKRETDAPDEINCIENQDGDIVDTLDSSIFLVKRGLIINPSADNGAKIRAIQLVVKDILLKKGYAVEHKPLKLKDFEEADEVFLAHDIYGIIWIGGFENFRYTKSLSAKIVEELRRNKLSL